MLKAHTLIDYCVDTALPSFPPSVSPVKERAVIIPDMWPHVCSQNPGCCPKPLQNE